MNSNKKMNFTLAIVVGLIALACMFTISMVFGAKDTTLRDVWLALTTHAVGDQLTVLRELRLPRETAGMIVGAALGVAGAVMQGLTRNPLADPGLIGLSSGANAALAFTMAMMPAVGYFGTMVACFIGAAVGACLVLGIGASRRGGMSPIRMVLAGSAVSLFLYAVAEGIGLAFKISKSVSMWTAGGLIGTTWGQVQTISPFIAIGIIAAIVLGKALTLLSANEEAAIGLGLRTAQIKFVLYAAVIVLTGASVALIGNMAFVGLMIPHIVRMVVGTDYRKVVPMSAIIGSIFILAADTISRTAIGDHELPMASVIAIIGLPFFLFIVRKGVKTTP
ncbi:iron complex transport system permease protein [Cohnella sp. OV330]|uniref:FecCD family ABC transporter permease n=1 Tax=Cohnella sp. OV330 TaxID=1855288 RepID=UPI0008E21D96|nr:iron ABC transporter permease [Cohnella sp. OV330]SFB61354.1 iron complex transport system permease protein [Cohnella sp. OV330]